MSEQAPYRLLRRFFAKTPEGTNNRQPQFLAAAGYLQSDCTESFQGTPSKWIVKCWNCELTDIPRQENGGTVFPARGQTRCQRASRNKQTAMIIKMARLNRILGILRVINQPIPIAARAQALTNLRTCPFSFEVPRQFPDWRPFAR